MPNVSQYTSKYNFIIAYLLSSEMVLNVSFDIVKTFWNGFEWVKMDAKVTLTINGYLFSSSC